MTKGVSEVKKLIETQVLNDNIYVQGNAFAGFQKTYFFTNENIKAYLNLVDLNECDNALTVLASGDQLFNLINKGITNIDTFDINELTEYYVFGIRLAMLEKYNYENYLKIFNMLLDDKTSFDTLNDILYGLLPHMDNKYRLFWKELLDYNYYLQKNKNEPLNIIRMVFLNSKNDKKFTKEYNNYLIDENEYNNLKLNLRRNKISFDVINAVDLHKKVKKKFDVILLSNILDYIYTYAGMEWDINRYIKKLYKISKDECIIFLHYIFQYYSNNYTRNNSLIWGANNQDEFFKKVSIKKLPLEKEEKVGDGIILIKK